MARLKRSFAYELISRYPSLVLEVWAWSSYYGEFELNIVTRMDHNGQRPFQSQEYMRGSPVIIRGGGARSVITLVVRYAVGGIYEEDVMSVRIQIASRREQHPKSVADLSTCTIISTHGQNVRVSTDRTAYSTHHAVG
jgi:hypothetical protein